jgi:hypothetical protein
MEGSPDFFLLLEFDIFLKIMTPSWNVLGKNFVVDIREDLINCLLYCTIVDIICPFY